MSSFKSHFKFNKQERSGIFFLLLFLISVQLGYYVYRSNGLNKSAPLQLNSIVQANIDSLKIIASQKDTVRIYPFNPNFITDFKGYTLGMSVAEIDRLHNFRKKAKFVNSVKEFQNVTKVSDSLLDNISPYFKFPEWTQNRKRKSAYKSNTFTLDNKVDKVAWKDLNTATAEDLKMISGIGEKLSARIIKFRDRLGGFLIEDQLLDVYGLDPDVVERTLTRFKVINKPEIVKINVNIATAKELSKLIYLQKDVAESIVNYRNLNGSINSLNELLKIEEFPEERINRIALYLSL
ncbi:ComEA family DNA-binding protein [Maribacter ulvicola]|uniref:DNA uptake protein ComE n=1 Tax=Maribacter ulvicola TaxID=228959 RepID=A0A1N7ACE6_9FLAO|nr:helix-hairpin-helix domain-containing protein [Maribacter ulvicola]SIR36738.1 DNA uptake protein ComE [Maribacter ulvicola]